MTKMPFGFVYRWTKLWHNKEISVGPTPPGIVCTMIEREETATIFRVTTVKKFINSCCSLKHTPLAQQVTSATFLVWG